ncbi:hypothetical protein D3C76_823260 [compost metagenome]
MSAKHRIIHTHATAGAILDDKVRVTGKDRIQPAQICTVMLQQPVSTAIRVRLCSDSGINVVIHLNVSHAIILNQTANNLVCMGYNLWISVVQLITAAVLYSFTMTHKEPAIISLRQLRTVNAHHFQLQPQARNHAFTANVIQHIFDSFRKTLLRRQPFPYSVPPFACGIPASIDTEVFASYLCSRINKRQ